MGKLYTIGSSVMEQEEFFRLLTGKQVDILVDVRSTPYSKYTPQFNKEALEEKTKLTGIQYQHEPEAFGARQKDPALYTKEGYLDFDKMRKSAAFKQKAAEYMAEADNGKNIAFMCTEKDPISCHRAIMVARGLALEGASVEHILQNGKILSQEELDERLVQLHFPDNGQVSLFEEYNTQSKEEKVREAYARQNAKIGYKLDKVLAQDKNVGTKEMTEQMVLGEEPKMYEKEPVTHFRKEYGFLSNMYDCPVTYKGHTFGSSEAAYQAQRCANPKDAEQFVSMSGRDAKITAKKVKTRADWDSVKAEIMEEIVRTKFTQNPELGKKLLATGNRELVEGNHWHDTYWGVCNGVGKNMLGNILMKVREELQKEKSMTQPEVDKVFTISVTGHRPNKLFGYDWNSPGNVALLDKIESTLRTTLEEAKEQGYKKFHVVTGMALGTDQMFAAHAIRLAASEEFKGTLTVEAAVPCKGQEKQWPEASQHIYNVLLSGCDSVTFVSDKGYTPKAMQDRNEYMVDKANVLLSVYDGQSSGGTKNCIDYAKRNGVAVKDVGFPELLKTYPRYKECTSLKGKFTKQSKENGHEK